MLQTQSEEEAEPSQSQALQYMPIDRSCQCWPVSVDAVRYWRCDWDLSTFRLFNLKMPNMKISSLKTSSQNLKGIYEEICILFPSENAFRYFGTLRNTSL